MHRVHLVHWNEDEARRRVDQLVGLGFAAAWKPLQGENPLNGFDSDVPDAFVIDLTRIPSHGREIGGALRRRKATRLVPLVFAGGEPGKVERVRSLLPDARYTSWDGIGEVLREAIAQPPAAPVQPGTMESYAGRAVPDKLGVRAGDVVLAIGPPAGFDVPGLPEGARLTSRAKEGDVVLCFARSRKELEQVFPKATARSRGGNRLWVLWPKKASGVRSDLGEQFVREFGMGCGWVDYKICAVDATWSGLQFARRGAKGAKAVRA